MWCGGARAEINTHADGCRGQRGLRRAIGAAPLTSLQLRSRCPELGARVQPEAQRATPQKGDPEEFGSQTRARLSPAISCVIPMDFGFPFGFWGNILANSFIWRVDFGLFSSRGTTMCLTDRKSLKDCKPQKYRARTYCGHHVIIRVRQPVLYRVGGS